MGKGDKKTRKGKIAKGSYGKTRPHNAKVASNLSPEKAEKTTTAEKTKKPSA